MCCIPNRPPPSDLEETGRERGQGVCVTCTYYSVGQFQVQGGGEKGGGRKEGGGEIVILKGKKCIEF